MTKETLLKFPCEFRIKAIGKKQDDLDKIVLAIVKKHAPEVDESAIEFNPSKNNNYLAVTVTFEAKSKEQLDAIYQEMTDSPHIIMTL